MTSTLVFIDTCTLLDSCWDTNNNQGVFNKKKECTFWDEELPRLLNMGRIILPSRNYEELIKHSNNTTNPDLAGRSEYILIKLNSLITDKKVELFGDANDPFADAILLSIALKFRTTKNMAFITQDTALAHDLNAIKRFESVRPRSGIDIKVRKINKKGEIVQWRNSPKRSGANTVFQKAHSFSALNSNSNPSPKWYEA